MRTVILSMPMPAGRQIHQPTAAAFYGYALRGEPGTSIVRTHAIGSAAQRNYDLLWAQAINEYEAGNATHFARLDADVVPTQENWLGVMLAELDAHAADVMSAVVPLKDANGLTSVAIDDTGDRWNPRRLTMHEVMDLPETFTDPAILLNTGVWVCDLSKAWVTAEADGRLAVSHHMRNKVVRGAAGRWEPRMRSEDWELSRDIRRAGGDRQYATRKITLYHELPQYTNAERWGECRRDPCHPELAVA